MQQAIDLLSFDLDGTLVDTAGEIAEAVNRALASHGLARRPVDEITLLIGSGSQALMRSLLERCARDQPAQAGKLDTQSVLQSMDQHYAATSGTSARPYAGCEQALRDLRAAGVRLACTTNKEIHHARRVLEATGLHDFFELVVGGDSLPHKKPHASVLAHVLTRMNVQPQRSAHVGDSAIDIAAARNTGIAAWAVPYGYNGGQPIADARPDRLFHSLPELAEHVLQAQHNRA